MEELSSTSASRNSELQKDLNAQIKDLQLEHQIMLRGLQDEIERLQQQCSSMQQQMIYHGIIPSIEDTLKQKLEELDVKLAANSQECDGLRAELCENKKLVEHLQEHVRQQDERYHEDVSARNLIVVRLRREVQEKTKAIATLSSLLHLGMDTVKEKVPLGRDFGKTHLKLNAENRSLPSVWNPNVAPSTASAPMPTGYLYKKLLKFQPKTSETLTTQPQCHPCWDAAEKTADKQPRASLRTSSAHYQNGNLSTRTFPGLKTISGGLPPEHLRAHVNVPHSLDLKRDDNSVLSLSVRLTNSKDMLEKP